MHPNDFIIQLIIAAGSGQKCVSISDEHVEQVHNLYKWKEVATGIFIPNPFCIRNNTNYVQNLQINSLQLQQISWHYFIALSIIFFIVPMRQTRSLNTVLSRARKTHFYFAYKGPQNKKKYYQIWKIKLGLSSHRLISMSWPYSESKHCPFQTPRETNHNDIPPLHGLVLISP